MLVSALRDLICVFFVVQVRNLIGFLHFLQVRKLQTHMQTEQNIQRNDQLMHLEQARVVRVEPVGMGDRMCVDLCANMSPGEGMLVGNFCRTLFLVHSEVRSFLCTA